MSSKTLAGVNMLKIGSHAPEVLQHCMQSVVKLAEEGKLNPHVHSMYRLDQLNEAHSALENRETIGKVGVYWV